MIAALTLPMLTCRKGGKINPAVYFGPVVDMKAAQGTCVCFDCAKKRNWLNADGNIRAGFKI